MIQFQIIYSPDELLSEVHTFSANLILLSNDLKRAHLKIDDPELKNIVYKLEVLTDSILVDSIPKLKPYLSNGKKTTGAKKHQAHDEITIGKTTIKILSFQKTLIPSDEPLPERYKRVSQNSKIAKSLETLEAELLHLEYLLNADNE